MNYWDACKTLGGMVLIAMLMMFAWFLWHTLGPITSYYLDFYITKWLGWHECGGEER